MDSLATMNVRGSTYRYSQMHATIPCAYVWAKDPKFQPQPMLESKVVFGHFCRIILLVQTVRPGAQSQLCFKAFLELKLRDHLAHIYKQRMLKFQPQPMLESKIVFGLQNKELTI
jgi:hypothetical protein